MLKVVSVEELLELFKNINNVGNEIVDINEIKGRVLAADIVSPQNIPGFNRSSVDGYAIKSRDTYLCSETMPAMLKYKGNISIGHKPEKAIVEGECLYIPTGGMLPEGADAVAMIEDCEEIGDEILINKSLSKWENVVFEDDDIKENEAVLNKGTELKAIHAAVLSGMGITNVEVKRKISAGIISTGDELVSPYEECEVPKVRDINGFYLKSVLDEDGCTANYYGITSDNEEELFNAVKKALDENDIVLLSGGSSAGNKDYTLNIMDKLGKVMFHGIAIKPGKPTMMAECGNKYIIGLPGHPLSCAVVYKFIISKFIDALYGRNRVEEFAEGIMSDNYHKAKGREEYLPVILDNGTVHPVYAKSSAMSVMARCSGFIRIGREIEGVSKGQKVKVLK